jgi:hypothetical protein
VVRAAALGTSYGRREDGLMTRAEVEAVAARGRPGWRVVDVALVAGEAGSSYEVAIERGDERRIHLLGPGKAIVGERR